MNNEIEKLQQEIEELKDIIRLNSEISLEEALEKEFMLLDLYRCQAYADEDNCSSLMRHNTARKSGEINGKPVYLLDVVNIDLVKLLLKAQYKAYRKNES